MHKPELLVLIAIWDFLVAAGAFIGIALISVFRIPSRYKPGIRPGPDRRHFRFKCDSAHFTGLAYRISGGRHRADAGQGMGACVEPGQRRAEPFLTAGRNRGRSPRDNLPYQVRCAPVF